MLHGTARISTFTLHQGRRRLVHGEPAAAPATAVEPATVVRHAATAIVVTDARLQVVAANPAYAGLTGRPVSEAIGKPLPNARDSDADGPPREVLLQHGAGGTRAVWMQLKAVRSASGAVSCHVATLSDVSALARELHALRHQAQHDPLTDLPNRRLLTEELGRSLARARRHGQRLAVLFIDLDRFKWVNDTLGHDAGDAVLRTIASRLRTTVRAEDLVGRWGGDEFIVVLDDPNDAAAVLGTARQVLAALGRRIDVAQHGVSASASIGAALFPDAGVATPADLIRRADAAMYRAKQAGRGLVQLSGCEA